MRFSFLADDVPLTDDAVQMFHGAIAEAKRRCHPYVGTEHFVLALVRNPSRIAGSTLAQFHIDLDRVENTFSGLIPIGTAEVGASWEFPYKIPYTNRARDAFSVAVEFARELGESTVDAEHLLIGLMRQEGIAAALLAEQGVTEQAMSDAIRQRNTDGANT